MSKKNKIWIAIGILILIAWILCVRAYAEPVANELAKINQQIATLEGQMNLAQQGLNAAQIKLYQLQGIRSYLEQQSKKESAKVETKENASIESFLGTKRAVRKKK